jgi:uncharacterized repeat protein (TIGR03803 family)
LIQAADGNFYGTTYYGGANSAGVVFRIAPGGTFTVVAATEIKATVPSGATTGFVQVVTPEATLSSNLIFRVKP